MSDPSRFLRLMAMLSPAFPVGAFTYSHGVEQAIADGFVHDRASLAGWLTALLRNGSGWNDAVLFAHGYRECDNAAQVSELAALAKALAGSRERQIETLALGKAFVDAAREAGSDVAAIDGIEVAYPAAVGVICGREKTGVELSAGAYMLAVTSNLVGAAQRLVPLGQADAVKVIAALEPLHVELACAAASSTLDDLGGAAFFSDIAAMRHEQLQPRIFRT